LNQWVNIFELLHNKHYVIDLQCFQFKIDYWNVLNWQDNHQNKMKYILSNKNEVCTWWNLNFVCLPEQNIEIFGIKNCKNWIDYTRVTLNWNLIIIWTLITCKLLRVTLESWRMFLFKNAFFSLHIWIFKTHHSKASPYGVTSDLWKSGTLLLIRRRHINATEFG
jgi:hypothetical protein